MNPPLRSSEDRVSIIDAIKDGTIDMIATDHAPHSEDEKDKGLANSAFGIVGLETAFPLLYTAFVKTGILSMEKLLEIMVYNPRKRFQIPRGNDFSIWDLEEEYTIDPKDFLSKGKASPFTGLSVCGRCLLTVYHGKVVYKGV